MYIVISSIRQFSVYNIFGYLHDHFGGSDWNVSSTHQSCDSSSVETASKISNKPTRHFVGAVWTSSRHVGQERDPRVALVDVNHRVMHALQNMWPHWMLWIFFKNYGTEGRCMAHATGVVIGLFLHTVHSAMADAFLATWGYWLEPRLMTSRILTRTKRSLSAVICMISCGYFITT